LAQKTRPRTLHWPEAAHRQPRLRPTASRTPSGPPMDRSRQDQFVLQRPLAGETFSPHFAHSIRSESTRLTRSGVIVNGIWKRRTHPGTPAFPTDGSRKTYRTALWQKQCPVTTPRPSTLKLDKNRYSHPSRIDMFRYNSIKATSGEVVWFHLFLHLASPRL
jgi:hypothetical protein